MVVVQKDEGEILEEKQDKKTERSPEKLDKTLDKRIINVDRNQVKLIFLCFFFKFFLNYLLEKKVYLEFKEMEGREYNDAIIHNNVNL